MVSRPAIHGGRLSSLIVASLIAAACSSASPTSAPAESTIPTTSFVVPGDVSAERVVFEKTWTGGVDPDEVSAAMKDHDAEGPIPLSLGPKDQMTLTILEQPGAEHPVVRVERTSPLDGTFALRSATVDRQRRCGAQRRGPEHNPRRVAIRTDTRSCWFSDDPQNTYTWFENGLHFTAESDQERQPTRNQLAKWHWLPFACNDFESVARAGDVDGDGRIDLLHESSGAPQLGVICLASGETVTTTNLHLDGPFRAVDVDGDGLFEVQTGSTTAYSATLTFNRFEDGSIHNLGDVTTGVHAVWRCVDFDEDPLLEIQQGLIDTQDGLSWTIVTYDLGEAGFVEIDRIDGLLENGPDEASDGFPGPEQRAELERLMGVPDDSWEPHGCNN